MNTKEPQSKKLGLFALIGVILVTAIAGGLYSFGVFGDNEPPPELGGAKGQGLQGFMVKGSSERGFLTFNKADVAQYEDDKLSKRITEKEIKIWAHPEDARASLTYFWANEPTKLMDIYKDIAPELNSETLIATYDPTLLEGDGLFTTTKNIVWKKITNIDPNAVLKKGQAVIVMVIGRNKMIAHDLNSASDISTSEMDILAVAKKGWNLFGGLSRDKILTLDKASDPSPSSIWLLNDGSGAFEKIDPSTLKKSDISTSIVWVKYLETPKAPEKPVVKQEEKPVVKPEDLLAVSVISAADETKFKYTPVFKEKITVATIEQVGYTKFKLERKILDKKLEIKKVNFKLSAGDCSMVAIMAALSPDGTICDKNFLTKDTLTLQKKDGTSWGTIDAITKGLSTYNWIAITPSLKLSATAKVGDKIQMEVSSVTFNIQGDTKEQILDLSKSPVKGGVLEIVAQAKPEPTTPAVITVTAKWTDKGEDIKIEWKKVDKATSYEIVIDGEGEGGGTYNIDQYGVMPGPQMENNTNIILEEFSIFASSDTTKGHGIKVTATDEEGTVVGKGTTTIAAKPAVKKPEPTGQTATQETDNILAVSVSDTDAANAPTGKYSNYSKFTFTNKSQLSAITIKNIKFELTKDATCSGLNTPQDIDNVFFMSSPSNKHLAVCTKNNEISYLTFTDEFLINKSGALDISPSFDILSAAEGKEIQLELISIDYTKADEEGAPYQTKEFTNITGKLLTVSAAPVVKTVMDSLEITQVVAGNKIVGLKIARTGDTEHLKGIQVSYKADKIAEKTALIIGDGETSIEVFYYLKSGFIEVSHLTNDIEYTFTLELIYDDGYNSSTAPVTKTATPTAPVVVMVTVDKNTAESPTTTSQLFPETPEVSLATFNIATTKAITINEIVLNDVVISVGDYIRKIYIFNGGKELYSKSNPTFPLTVQLSTNFSENIPLEIKADILKTAAKGATHKIKLTSLIVSDSNATINGVPVEGNIMTISSIDKLVITADGHPLVALVEDNGNITDKSKMLAQFHLKAGNTEITPKTIKLVSKEPSCINNFKNLYFKYNGGNIGSTNQAPASTISITSDPAFSLQAKAEDGTEYETIIFLYSDALIATDIPLPFDCKIAIESIDTDYGLMSFKNDLKYYEDSDTKDGLTVEKYVAPATSLDYGFASVFNVIDMILNLFK